MILPDFVGMHTRRKRDPASIAKQEMGAAFRTTQFRHLYGAGHGDMVASLFHGRDVVWSNGDGVVTIG